MRWRKNAARISGEIGAPLCGEFAGDATASFQFVLTDTDWLFPAAPFHSAVARNQRGALRLEKEIWD